MLTAILKGLFSRTARVSAWVIADAALLADITASAQSDADLDKETCRTRGLTALASYGTTSEKTQGSPAACASINTKPNPS